MIDETKVIKKLQTRIDEFVKVHPFQKNCESIQVIEEFIELLENEAVAEAKRKELMRRRWKNIKQQQNTREFCPGVKL